LWLLCPHILGLASGATIGVLSAGETVGPPHECEVAVGEAAVVVVASAEARSVVARMVAALAREQALAQAEQAPGRAARSPLASLG